MKTIHTLATSTRPPRAYNYFIKLITDEAEAVNTINDAKRAFPFTLNGRHWNVKLHRGGIGLSNSARTSKPHLQHSPFSDRLSSEGAPLPQLRLHH